MICENASYRKASNILNRVLHFEDDTRRVKASTLSDRVNYFAHKLGIRLFYSIICEQIPIISLDFVIFSL